VSIKIVPMLMFLFSFLYDGRGLNSGSCIYYALSLPTKLCSQGPVNVSSREYN